MSRQAGRFRLEEATIAGLHGAMKNKKLTCRQLVERYLDRIEAYDTSGPCLRSVIRVHPGASEIADELDRKFRQSGFAGPLHGMPVLLKDNINTRDMETTGGSVSLRAISLERTPSLSSDSVKQGQFFLPRRTSMSLPSGVRPSAPFSGKPSIPMI